MQFNRGSDKIAEGMRRLIKVVKSSNKGPDGNAPKILLIAPQPIILLKNQHSQIDANSIKKSNDLGKLYAKLANEEKIDFINASTLINSSYLDGIHLDEVGSEKFGAAVSEKVMQIL